MTANFNATNSNQLITLDKNKFSCEFFMKSSSTLIEVSVVRSKL